MKLFTETRQTGRYQLICGAVIYNSDGLLGRMGRREVTPAFRRETDTAVGYWWANLTLHRADFAVFPKPIAPACVRVSSKVRVALTSEAARLRLER